MVAHRLLRNRQFLNTQGQGVVAASGGSHALMSNVLEYFAMNGTAGATETGAVAGTVMSVVNNVGSSATGGPSSERVRDFERDSVQYLTVAAPDNGLFDIGNQNRMFSVWCKPETDNLSMGLVSRYISGAATRQFLFYRLSGNRAQAIGVEADNSTTSCTPITTNITATQWQLVWYWYNASTQRIGACLNADADTEVAFPDAGLKADATDPFRIGWQTGNNFWDGLIGPITFWDKVLNQTERTYVYNSGLFRPYPYLV